MPEDTAPPQGGVQGSVCPVCQRAFEDCTRTTCPDDGSPLLRNADIAEADGDPMLGRLLASRFTILARIGAGSMGTVYRAKQAPIGRDVAIKILRSDRAVDEVSRARFLREARANSLLTSPNTVTVFDFGQGDGGDFYLAMELLEGESLGQRIKRLGRISAEEAVDTVKQALRSLAEAHAKGIVHRDLKPDNLFYARVRTNETYEEIVKVLDFGIAKMMLADVDPELNAVETQAGTVFGTPRYMSPEQAQGKALDARSDLYALGVILYHMLAGRPPFTDDDAIVVMARHIKTMPRPLSEVAPDARVPPELESLVMRVLSKDPDKRPESADAMNAELTRVKEAAVVTSGVRASLSGSLDVPLERTKSGPSSAPPTALAHDTLSSPASRRGSVRRFKFVGLAVLCIAVTLMAFAGTIARHVRRGQPSAPFPVRVESPPSVPASPSPVVAPPGPQSPVGAPSGRSGPASSTPSAASSAGPTLQVRPEGARTERPLRIPRSGPSSNGSARPSGSSNVGYGYLE